MKKSKIISLILCGMLLSFGSVYAKKDDTPISKITVSGIDYPYSTGSVLDTTAELTRDSRSIISNLSWTKTSNGEYKVTVVVRPDINYCYDANTTATINGKAASNVLINEDEYLEISYVFPKDSTAPNPNSSNSLTHTITVMYMQNGTISPNPIKAPHNKNFTVQIIPDEGYEVEDVRVDGESVGAVTEYTFRRVTDTHKIKAYFKAIEGYVPSEDDEIPEKEFLFTDVSENDWYYESVKYVFEKEIFSGTSETKFSPNNNMTRGMLVKALYNIEEKNQTITKATNIFDDVAEDAWYKDAVAWAAANNIVNGVGNNLFAPDKEVTREQVASILYRYAKYKEKDVSVGENTNILSYDDFSEISEYAIPALQWACGSGVINGKTVSTIAPRATATRAEVAKMLTNFLQVETL